ncbi:MAG: CARDB domain-containing protein [Actinomycetota bacterium]
MRVIFQYAAKFVVGRSKGEVLAPGEYWTAVNIHNPHRRAVRFRVKVAVGLPGKAGEVSEFIEMKLGPDEAIEIDRKLIHELGRAKDFLKGFVVVESPIELDVVSVYTAAGDDKAVETIHTERVGPRKIEVGLPDLVPVPDDSGSFCRRDKENNLTVTVCNHGSAPAGPSVTQVDFGTHGAASVPTPALAEGACIDLKVPIPPGCFDPDCEFRITVDVNNDVDEEIESNNFASGICLG